MTEAEHIIMRRGIFACLLQEGQHTLESIFQFLVGYMRDKTVNKKHLKVQLDRFARENVLIVHKIGRNTLYEIY